ncbi:MAG: hypothetical protein PVI82_17210 [Desulfobacterales bacterium]|jgi:hypothetical protein
MRTARRLTLLGSADGLFHIHTCLLDHGDIALVKAFCFKVLDEIAVWMIPGSMYGNCGEVSFLV